MSGFQVSVAATARASAVTGESAAALRAMLAELVGQVEDVVDSRWRGDAAAAFAQACARWRDAAEIVCRCLVEMADALQATAHAYADADRLGAELLRAAA